MNHEDMVSEKDKYFIELPLCNAQVEEILADLINNVQQNVGR